MAKELMTRETKPEIKTCGIIMPISDHLDYPNGHWIDVLNILKEAIELADFQPNLVSDDPAIGLIHERIVTNLYNNEIVVCDVSSKNPNVMFELGLRLAFDKPTIIVKDCITSYSFDTGVIEHLEYPNSLRFNTIVEFKKRLTASITATYEKSVSSVGFSPFLKSFGNKIVPAKIEGREISENEFVINELKGIKSLLQMIDYNSNYEANYSNYRENAKKTMTSLKGSNFINPNTEFYFDAIQQIYERSPSIDNMQLEKQVNNLFQKKGFYIDSNTFSQALNSYIMYKDLIKDKTDNKSKAK